MEKEEPKLHALILGRTLMLLRERQGLRQAELADQMGIPASTMSTIEKGTGRVDTQELVRFASALRVEPVYILGLVDQGMLCASKIVKLALKVPAKSCWSEAQERVGPRGLEGLLTFVVAAVLSEP